MTDNVTVVPETGSVTPSRFNLLKIAKITAVTAAAAGLVLVVKSKLNGSVDGSVTATVETDSQS